MSHIFERDGYTERAKERDCILNGPDPLTTCKLSDKFIQRYATNTIEHLECKK